MARGNSNQSSNKLFIAKIKTKENDKEVAPFFQLTEKNDDGKWVDCDKTKSLSGDLVKIQFEKGEYKGNEYDVIKLTLRDNEVKEDYLLDLRLNLLSRGLYNSLLNLAGSDDFKGLSISVYETKKGEKTYPAVAVRQNDNLVKWRYSLDELPKVKRIQVKGKADVIDSSELDDFLLNGLKELAAEVNKNSKSAPKKDISQPVDDEDLPPEVIGEEENGEEIPF